MFVSTARESTYTHFLLKEGISPDASKTNVIVGMQFNFTNPDNKKSPVLGGFRDKKKVIEVVEEKKEVVEGEVKEEKNEKVISTLK